MSLPSGDYFDLVREYSALDDNALRLHYNAALAAVDPPRTTDDPPDALLLKIYLDMPLDYLDTHWRAVSRAHARFHPTIRPDEHRVSPRKMLRKRYRLMLPDGGEIIKDIYHDVTPQVRPSADSPIQPSPTPNQGEVNARVAEEVAGRTVRAIKEGLEERGQPQTDLRGVLAQALAGPPPAAPAPAPLTRDAALEKLASYLGAEVKDGETLDTQGVVIRLADHLGALVANLDGTEQFVERVRLSAKHPKFIFRNRLNDVRADVGQAQALLQGFIWNLASENPEEAITDLRQARDLIARAVTALTGEGTEILPGRGAYPNHTPTELEPMGNDVERRMRQ